MISRAKLAALRADTRVSVTAGELLALLTLAESHDADCRPPASTESDETHLSCVSGRADREIGSESRGPCRCIVGSQHYVSDHASRA